MTGPRVGDVRLHTHHHAVQFYGDAHDLATTVGMFLIEGLVARQPALVIATPPHVVAILDQFAERHIDVAGARRLGDLVVLDADETLGAFMREGMPDPELFRRHLGQVLEDSVRGRERTPVRAYGEMVDVLWRRGASDAAIRLEVLWNELAATHAFSLMCGYAIGNFYKQAARVEAITAQHTHVLGRPPRGVPFEVRS